MTVAAADGLRVLNIAFYAATVTGTLWIVLTYYQLWIRERTRANWIGLLPKHVYLIGISYIAYASASIGRSFGDFGGPLTPFTVVNLFAGVVGLRAIITMIRFQQKRLLP